MAPRSRRRPQPHELATGSPDLALDLELRPPGAPPATMGHYLAPRLGEFIREMYATLAQMQRLVGEFRSAGDKLGESAMLVKLAERLERLIVIAKSEPVIQHELSLEHYPAEIRERLVEALTAAMDWEREQNRESD